VLAIGLFNIQLIFFSFKSIGFLRFEEIDWLTIQIPTIFICVFYSTIICSKFYEIVRMDQKKKKKTIQFKSYKNYLQLFIFLSEFLFFLLVLIMSVFYSDLELGVMRAKLFSNYLFVAISLNLVFQTLVLWLSVLVPMKRIMDAYKGKLPKGQKELKLELFKIKMTRKFKDLVNFQKNFLIFLGAN